MTNLDNDIIQAMRLGYGVHYGAYKAANPSTKPVTEQTHILCAECGNKIYNPRPNQRYCCRECQQRAWAEQHRQREKEAQNVGKTLAE